MIRYAELALLQSRQVRLRAGQLRRGNVTDGGWNHTEPLDGLRVQGCEALYQFDPQVTCTATLRAHSEGARLWASWGVYPFGTALPLSTLPVPCKWSLV